MKAVALVCLVALAGCAPRHDSSAPRAPAETGATATPSPPEPLPLGLALKDDGRSVQLAPGRVLLISLHANHTTGYRWVLADSAQGVLAREGDPAYEAEQIPGVGAGGFETWRFRAVQAGTGTIALQYRRPWEKKAPETTVRYTIEVR